MSNPEFANFENNESCVDRYDVDAMYDMGYIDKPEYEDDYEYDYEDDGQPSEYTEWMDFDPDC
jgi:hypothetical protein